ncbi:SDR family oxidoreductase [Clostridium kluyveri]|uniref:3-oxoacyl-ACP reductase n=1 Tax=Clostridium kluyveri TaxID=1534 RepID=A0A1L5F9M7_CLOKL|nr:SDR family oxidoreductase [Clostridium kluyveri]APM39673.1 3-oxoacyl-ACP reductase [Clostridium kluyveri]UZQ50171.1 SDR family oxidoreductase [Clostridium kluyveri]
MKTAIVTGASSGIGFEISKRLLKMGYKVYGFGRDFSKVDSYDSNFIQEVCDIIEVNTLVKIIEKIKKENKVCLLVNNAGVGYFGPHEELNPKKIHLMVSTNLEVPMVLCNVLLRDLKKNKGMIINISSVTAKYVSTYGCAYAATKAGLTHFSESLFSEIRKTGVKVLSVHPDMTKSNFYRNANFSEDDSDTDFYIDSEVIADTVKSILMQGSNIAVTDITIRPQKHRIRRK